MSELLYARLPICMQQLAVSAVGWKTNRYRYSSSFGQLLHEYESRSKWAQEQMQEYQNQRLAETIQQAFRTSPFYQSQTDGSIDYSTIRCLDDLQKLPVLTRAKVQQATDSIPPKNYDPRSVQISHTSGSTGSGLRFPVSQKTHQEQWAVWWRFRGWHGIHRGEGCLYFGGRSVVPLKQSKPPFWRNNIPGKQILFSGYHLSPETAREYLDEMQRSGLQWIHGYPSIISLLGQYSLELGYKIKAKWVTTGAESLLENQKAIIHKAFGVSPIEHYGMAEGVANISQCPHGKLHVDEDYSAVEFFPTSDKDVYQVLGTGFTNPLFPLVRYEVGDVVTVSGTTCDCGNPGRVVDEIDGRQEDFVVMKNGTRLGRLDHIFKDSTNIKEAQIVQEKIGEVTIRVVPGSNFCDQDELQLRQEIDKRVGDFLDYSILHVDKIERTKRGKLRFVISTVEQ